MSKVRSRFSISGRSVDPRFISAALARMPTRTSLECPDRSGFHYWELVVECNSLKISDHITGILSSLDLNRVKALRRQLAEGDDVEFNLFVLVSELDQGSLPSLVLPPMICGKLHDVGVSVVIDMN